MDFLNINTVELFGYLASLFVLMSFLLKDIKKLRIVNTVGCTFFVIYGILLATSWPIIITNVSIIIINIYHLVKASEESSI